MILPPFNRICALALISIVSFGMFHTNASQATAQTEKEEQILPQTERGAYQFSFTSIDGAPMPLANFKGQVMLIVNTASQCGFTKQYEGLQDLHEKYQDQGFTVIGVPCNNFGNQEPSSTEHIKEFIKNQYGVTFPMTEKYDVSGDDIHPFFEWAIEQDKGGLLFSKPRWNFHKYLIDRKGQVVKSFGSSVEPMSDRITSEIEKLL